MKKLFALISTLLLAVSCGPSAVYFDVDVRNSNSSDLNTAGGKVAVFAITPEEKADSIAIAQAAMGIASQYEADQGLDAQSVPAYTVPKKEFSGFPGRVNGKMATDTSYITRLMIKSASEILIFIDNLTFATSTIRNAATYEYPNAISMDLPYYLEINAFDAINDKVLLSKEMQDTVTVLLTNGAENGKTAAGTIAEQFGAISAKIGENVAQCLSTQWNTETWLIVDYPNSDAWHSPAELAKNFKWEDAIQKWMPLTEDKNTQKAAYASFNIAVACEMLGQTSLAKEWITFSRQKYSFRESGELLNYLNTKD